ncbi:MAG: hypothetical protein IJS61_08910 [Firmicutes bacterium]|nr:hypothetical protein [Bacillota bacterium]
MRKFLKTILPVAVIALSFVGCNNTKPQEPKTFIDVTEEGNVVANFDVVDTGVEGGSGITIGENEYLAIDSRLSSGKVHVSVAHGGSDINTLPTKENTGTPTIDRDVEGEGVTEYYEITPGDYMINVKVTEKSAGKIYFNILDKEGATENTQTESESAVG